MFETHFGSLIPGISHKRIPSPNKFNYQNHFHNFCEVLLFVSGDAEFNINGQLYSPKPYDLFLIPEGIYHYVIPHANVPYENYVISLSLELIEERHYQRVFTPPYKINIRSNPELMRFFNLLDYYHDNYTPEDFEMCTLMLVRELVVCCSYQPKVKPAEDGLENQLVRGIVEYISENLTSPLNAEIISKHFYLSKSYVQNAFSETMHIGLKQYILQKRLYAAYADIERGVSPGTVCKRYQFNDYTGFYRLYKKLFGVSPRNTVSERR